ncbi:MAG: hypothetical protein EHM14_02600 [Methanothrix sp.]|nr:MAG: hypothetical protein EHM14_02600 [Methanothrix sp.]
MNIDNGVTGTHSLVYRAIGQDAYLEDLGIASNGVQPYWYRFTVQWGDPESYIFGMDASASVQKASLDFKAKPTVKK